MDPLFVHNTSDTTFSRALRKPTAFLVVLIRTIIWKTLENPFDTRFSPKFSMQVVVGCSLSPMDVSHLEAMSKCSELAVTILVVRSAFRGALDTTVELATLAL